MTATGLFGWYMQNLIPRWLIEAVPDETIHSQLDDLAEQLCADARRFAGLHDATAETRELLASQGRRSINVVSTGASRRGLVPISIIASACSMPAMVELNR